MSTETPPIRTLRRRSAPAMPNAVRRAFKRVGSHPWIEYVRERLRQYDVRGFLFSVTIHSVLLIILSLFFFDSVAGPAPVASLIGKMGAPGDDGGGFDEILDTGLDAAPADELPVQIEPFEAAPVVDGADLEVPVPVSGPDESVLASVAGGEGGENGGGGTGEGIDVALPHFGVPDSGQVITKGSFTAWTVPEDPEPGQPYDIHILIDLPRTLKKYSHRDLVGTVVGTDGYEQILPYDIYVPGATTTIDADGERRVVGRKGDLPLRQGQALLIINIPRAAPKVRDKIEIRSRLLREQQTLEIEF